MKITKVEPFLVDGGWRPFIFVKVETDEGITGWGECTDPRSPNGVGRHDQGPDAGAYRARPWGVRNALVGYVPGIQAESRRDRGQGHRRN